MRSVTRLNGRSDAAFIAGETGVSSGFRQRFKKNDVLLYVLGEERKQSRSAPSQMFPLLANVIIK